MTRNFYSAHDMIVDDDGRVGTIVVTHRSRDARGSYRLTRDSGCVASRPITRREADALWADTARRSRERDGKSR
jgi:hypothetical protein